MEHNDRLTNTRRLLSTRSSKGKTSHSDSENFYYVWGDGRTDGAAFSNEDVKADYEERGEEQVPLGIHGTSIAVDCLDATFEGTGLIEMDERLDYTKKSQPIR